MSFNRELRDRMAFEIYKDLIIRNMAIEGNEYSDSVKMTLPPLNMLIDSAFELATEFVKAAAERANGENGA